MKTKLLLMACLSLMGLSDLTAQNHSYKGREKEGKLKVLCLGGGHWHDDLSNAAILRNCLENEAGYYLTYSEDLGSVARLGKESDLILIHSMLYDASAEEVQVLLDLIKGGKPLVAIHGATASYFDGSHPAFTKMLGGRFTHHPPYGPFIVRTVDPDHFITKGIDSLTVQDELYIHVDLDPDLHILMEAEHEGEKRPMAWTKTYGKGKIFYLAPGHNEKTNNDPVFQQLVKNGMKWVLD